MPTVCGGIVERFNLSTSTEPTGPANEFTNAEKAKLARDVYNVAFTAATHDTSTFLNVGSTYIIAGVIQTNSLVFLGTLAAGDTAELELRREFDGALVATWSSVNTVPENVPLGSTPSIPADDWYHWRLRVTAETDTARVLGVSLIVIP